ncbi:hypothetical protein [Tautonia sociabilis]|uniref:Uncharacterized protein n=1 Tax=Tautonia sociabilis TaxID=2080755 RepID=A0A432MQT5_9BACT|nr:hypothetical protein [Tautonia sociabilis]RUL89619.1 hypothetical protein TsocGM_00145 [Tautonia sociabilis]
MDRLLSMPMCWAQTAPDQSRFPLLALRRWFWGQTLSSPRAEPGSEGLVAWVLGLLVLLAVAMAAQGPGKALRQLFDLPGHVRLIGEATARLRTSARLVMILLGVAVLSWTSALVARYNRPEGLADLALLTGSRSAVELAIEQAGLAALTPLRDLFSLADLIVLLGVGAFVSFKFAADRWGDPEAEPMGKPLPLWGTVAWVSAALYGLYRLAQMMATGGDLPIGGGLLVEPLVVPALMLVADGLLASWVLVELARAERSSDVEPFRTAAVLSVLPAAALACLLVLPARYAAVAAYLSLPYVPVEVARAAIGPVLGGWGLVSLQGAAVVTAGLAGAVPWCRGGPGSALRGFGRLLRAEGGHLVAALAVGGIAAGFPAGLAYLVMLSLPAQPWVLPAAESYAHYATIMVGLGLLAALVELGGRSVLPARQGEREAVAEAAGAAS